MYVEKLTRFENLSIFRSSCFCACSKGHKLLFLHHLIICDVKCRNVEAMLDVHVVKRKQGSDINLIYSGEVGVSLVAAFISPEISLISKLSIVAY